MDFSVKTVTSVLAGLLLALRQNIAVTLKIEPHAMLAIDGAIFLLVVSLAAYIFRHWLREAGDIAGKLICVALLSYAVLVAINLALVSFNSISEHHPDWQHSDILLSLSGYCGSYLVGNATTVIAIFRDQFGEIKQ